MAITNYQDPIINYDTELEKHIILADDEGPDTFKINMLLNDYYITNINMNDLRPFNYVLKETDQDFNNNGIDFQTPLCMLEPPHIHYLFSKTYSYADQQIIEEIIDLDQDSQLLYILTNNFQIRMAALSGKDEFILTRLGAGQFLTVDTTAISYENVTSADIAVLENKGVIFVSNKFMYYVTVNMTSLLEIFENYFANNFNPYNPQNISDNGMFSFGLSVIDIYKPCDTVYKVVALDYFVYVACGSQGVYIYEINEDTKVFELVENIDNNFLNVSKVNMTDLSVGGLDYTQASKIKVHDSENSDIPIKYNEMIIDDNTEYKKTSKKVSVGNMLVITDPINGVYLFNISDLKPKSDIKHKYVIKPYPFSIPIKNLSKVVTFNEILFVGGEDEDPNTDSTYLLYEIFLYGANSSSLSKTQVEKLPIQDLYRTNRLLTFYSQPLSLYLDEKYLYINGENFQETYSYGINSTFQRDFEKVQDFQLNTGILAMAIFKNTYPSKQNHIITLSKSSYSIHIIREESIIIRCSTSLDLHPSVQPNKNYYFKAEIYTAECPKKVNTTNELISQFQDVCKYVYQFEVAVKEPIIEFLAGDTPTSGFFIGLILAGVLGCLICIGVIIGVIRYIRLYRQALIKYESLDNKQRRPQSMGMIVYKSNNGEVKQAKDNL